MINGASSYNRINSVDGSTGNPGSTGYANKALKVFKGKESFQGDIGELLLYGGALSTANMILIETYLNSKWSVY